MAATVLSDYAYRINTLTWHIIMFAAYYYAEQYPVHYFNTAVSSQKITYIATYHFSASN